MNFEQAFDLLMLREGGYSDGKGDPGGETKYGISKRAYPHEDIANLTLSRAKQLYLRDYWGPAGCDAVPDLLRYPLFDFAVNFGVKTAVKTLQRLLGEHPDGIIGSATLAAISSWDIGTLCLSLEMQRLEILTTLQNWPSASKGWTRRIIANVRLILSEKV